LSKAAVIVAFDATFAVPPGRAGEAPPESGPESVSATSTGS
jgi:hypothetical protein